MAGKKRRALALLLILTVVFSSFGGWVATVVASSVGASAVGVADLSGDPGLFWRYEDLRALDTWGDADTDSRDIVAVYLRQSDDVLYLRADLLDLRGDSSVNVYFALDYVEGGATELISGRGDLASGLTWDLLVAVPGVGEPSVLDSTYVTHPSDLVNFAFDSVLDFVSCSVRRAALAGWGDGEIRVQVITTDGASASIVDESTPAASTASTGRAKFIFVFGNMFSGYSPGAVSWWDGYAVDSTHREGVRRGTRYFFDAFEKYGLPVASVDVRFDVLPGEEYLKVNDRLRDLSKRGLLDILETLTYGYFMPWYPGDVDAQAIKLAREYKERLGIPLSGIFAPYEVELTGGDLESIADAGYKSLYGGDRYGYWFGWVQDWSNETAVRARIDAVRKVHRINGINVLFDARVGSYGGFAWDPRWGDLVFPNEYDLYQGTDGGLHLWWRRILLDMAGDEDQEQYYTVGTDLNLTPMVFQDVAEMNARWVASHPWIEATTFSSILSRGWSVIDDGMLGLGANEPLERYTYPEDLHYNSYFWQFYYGGVADGHSPIIPKGTVIEGYFDYVPYLRDGQKIPSGLKMGDSSTPGTIIHDTLANLRSAPDNPITTLAWISYLTSTGEMTFHSQRNYKGGEQVLDDWGGPYLHPFAKLKANDVRQVNKIVAAANWADDAAKGKLGGTQVLRLDLDLDGEDEYVMENDRVFAVFENDGGRLEYAFAYDESTGPVQLVAPTYQQYGLVEPGWNFEDGEVALRPTLHISPMLWDASFMDGGYEYSLYGALNNATSLTFTSGDGVVTKTFRLTGDTVYASYSVKSGDELLLGYGLPANMANLFTRNWVDGVAPVNTTYGVGWEVESGGYGVVDLMDTRLVSTDSFIDSPVREDMREPDNPGEYPSGHWFFFPYNTVTVAGSGEFEVALTLSAVPTLGSDVTLTAEPSTIEVGKALALSGRVSAPSYVDWAGSSVLVEYTKPGGGVESRSLALESDGSFRGSLTATAAGEWGVKATWGGTPHLLGSSISTKIVVSSPPPGIDFIDPVIALATVLLVVVVAGRRRGVRGSPRVVS